MCSEANTNWSAEFMSRSWATRDAGIVAQTAVSITKVAGLAAMAAIASSALSPQHGGVVRTFLTASVIASVAGIVMEIVAAHRLPRLYEHLAEELRLMSGMHSGIPELAKPAQEEGKRADRQKLGTHMLALLATISGATAGVLLASAFLLPCLVG